MIQISSRSVFSFGVLGDVFTINTLSRHPHLCLLKRDGLLPGTVPTLDPSQGMAICFHCWPHSGQRCTQQKYRGVLPDNRGGNILSFRRLWLRKR